MTATAWHFGDLMDLTARTIDPATPALVHDGAVTDWASFDRRSNALARALLDGGLVPGDKVAFYHRNGTAYPELLAACFKARLVHVNVNYRYRDTELAHVIANSDAAAVSFDADFAATCDRVRDRLPAVRLWLQKGGTARPWAQDFDRLAGGDGTPLDPGRDGHDDTLMVYTGGTTGMPKGVVWTHHALRSQQIAAFSRLAPVPDDTDDHARLIRERQAPTPFFPACPWMHGTGLSTALNALVMGEPVVTVSNDRGFDPVAHWRAVGESGVRHMAIVGDAFARPLVEALESGSADVADARALAVLLSSGAMLTAEIKERLLALLPNLVIADIFGSSETMGFGVALSQKGAVNATATLSPVEGCRVIREDGTPVPPGSDEMGLIAHGGTIGSGYYKDREKTEATYRMIDGERLCIPGDWAMVAADGTITLLGRGSGCINTGGEKVFPEEVEECLKRADGVADALVFGVDDPRWGSRVTAVVEGTGLDPERLIAHVHDTLAPYKAPKAVYLVDQVPRGPNGKADYKAARAMATERDRRAREGARP
ncbi:AMP-binding protein [Yunchengibacter salinarum]|uniref:AMP-binding protein n=1 Tax=Yunchengibacter salinarum TaxID=3133399 RepID=UPI0035B68FEA